MITYPTLFVHNVMDLGIDVPKDKPIEKKIRDDIERKVKEIVKEIKKEEIENNIKVKSIEFLYLFYLKNIFNHMRKTIQ